MRRLVDGTLFGTASPNLSFTSIFLLGHFQGIQDIGVQSWVTAVVARNISEIKKLSMSLVSKTM